MAEQYSNLNVHGKITQKAEQGTTDNDVLKVGGIAPLSTIPSTSTGIEPSYFKGQTAVVNGATYICSAITNNAGSSAPTSSTVWTYTWTPMSSPDNVTGPQSATDGHVAVFDGTTGKAIKDSGVTLGTAAEKTASTHAINSTNAGSSGSYKDELATNGQVYTALTDGTVTKVGTSTVGGTLQPIYLNNGAPTAGTQLYADKVKINGETTTIMSTGGGSTSFYAPTSIGGQNGDVPRWYSSGNESTVVWGSVDSEVTQDSLYLITSGAVWTAINNAIAELPQAMIFRGTLGTGGTITSLPTAGSTYEGDVYKVITAGTYASQSAKVGDTFICGKTGTSTYSWVLIPSGDEPDGTVTNVATGVGLTGGPITTSGTIKAKLKNGDTASSLASATTTTTASRQYAVEPDSSGYLSVNVPWENTHQTIKQDGITGATANRYAVCSTAASTAAKTASVTSGTFSLETGARVTVKFNNANTATVPTLNINSTGAKYIIHKGNQVTYNSTNGGSSILSGVCDFVYDGSAWNLIGDNDGKVLINETTMSSNQPLLIAPDVIGGSDYYGGACADAGLTYGRSGLFIGGSSDGVQISSSYGIAIKTNGEPDVSISSLSGVISTNGFTGNLTGNVTGNCSGSAGSVAWSGITSNPLAATDVTLADM